MNLNTKTYAEDYYLAETLQNIENEEQLRELLKSQEMSRFIASDRALAEQLSTQLNQDPYRRNEAIVRYQNTSVVAPELELLDPNPDIWQLMRDFDRKFFDGILAHYCIELSWDSEMTRSAGQCYWNTWTNYCAISLSRPLLQFRPRSDLVNTLLHEMIHALLFVTRTDDNHDSHGPMFHYHAQRINQMCGSRITVYHNFVDEVQYLEGREHGYGRHRHRRSRIPKPFRSMVPFRRRHGRYNPVVLGLLAGALLTGLFQLMR